MSKTKIDEDKSTPLGDLHRWGRKWLERGVNTPELVGCLSLTKDLILSFFSERDCLQEATKRLKRLESENTQMREWLNDCANGVMEGECYYDHHGRCQQHLWWDDDTNECIVKRIREFLKPEEPQA